MSPIEDRADTCPRDIRADPCVTRDSEPSERRCFPETSADARTHSMAAGFHATAGRCPSKWPRGGQIPKPARTAGTANHRYAGHGQKGDRVSTERTERFAEHVVAPERRGPQYVTPSHDARARNG